VLVGYMQGPADARTYGVAPTANAGRDPMHTPPMPRHDQAPICWAVDVAPGDIVADLKAGIYAVGFGGGQGLDITNGKFVFSHAPKALTALPQRGRGRSGQKGGPL